MKTRSLVLSTLVVVLLMALSAFAELPAAGPWKVQIETGLGVTQASYSDNWTGGESGSIIWVADFHAKADRQFSASWFLGNELKLAFGQSHSQVDSTKKWQEPKKSSDKIRYDAILRLTKGWLIDPYVAGTFESQFLDASDKNKKRYLNPFETTEATGVARQIINVPDQSSLSTRLGFALRQRHTAFTDSINDLGSTLTETTNDGGAEWVTDFTLGSAKAKYSFISKLTVFQALFHDRTGGYELPAGVKEGNEWKTADVNWDNTLRVNLTSIIQTSLAWQLLYDKQIAKAGRFKETLTLGLAYKFGN
jgi:hypothetical protein